MAIISLNGLPGQGKTLTATHMALKKFKKDNTRIKRFIRFLRRKSIWENLVYSNYPICLNNRKKIYSNKVSIYDLKNQYHFPIGSTIIIDEVQLFYDSDEYKTFPRIIANFNQAHRHFGICDIIYITQHPSRLVKKLRNVVSVYYRIKRKICIPILKVGFVSARATYEFEDYELAFTKDKDLMKMRDIQGKVWFMNFRKVFKAYDTVYLYPLNADKPPIDSNSYDSVHLDQEIVNDLESHLF